MQCVCGIDLPFLYCADGAHVLDILVLFGVQRHSLTSYSKPCQVGTLIGNVDQKSKTIFHFGHLRNNKIGSQVHTFYNDPVPLAVVVPQYLRKTLVDCL